MPRGMSDQSLSRVKFFSVSGALLQFELLNQVSNIYTHTAVLESYITNMGWNVHELEDGILLITDKGLPGLVEGKNEHRGSASSEDCGWVYKPESKNGTSDFGLLQDPPITNWKPNFLSKIIKELNHEFY